MLLFFGRPLLPVIPVVDTRILEQVRQAFFDAEGIIGQLKKKLELIILLKDTADDFRRLVTVTLEKLSIEEQMEMLPFNTYIYLEEAPFLFDPHQKEIWAGVYRRIRTLFDLYHLMDQSVFTGNEIYKTSKTRREWIDRILESNRRRLTDILNLIELAADTRDQQKNRANSIKNWNAALHRFSSPYTFDDPGQLFDFLEDNSTAYTGHLFEHKIIYMLARLSLENLKQKTTRNLMIRALLELKTKDKIRHLNRRKNYLQEMEQWRRYHVD
jgi:hypothetical protein